MQLNGGSTIYISLKKKKPRKIALDLLGKKGVSVEIILFNKTVKNGKILKYYTLVESSHELQ